MTAFILTTVLIMGLTPFIFYICSGRKSLAMEIFLRKYFICRFSKYFGKYEGSFVLYTILEMMSGAYMV